MIESRAQFVVASRVSRSAPFLKKKNTKTKAKKTKKRKVEGNFLTLPISSFPEVTAAASTPAGEDAKTRTNQNPDPDRRDNQVRGHGPRTDPNPKTDKNQGPIQGPSPDHPDPVQNELKVQLTQPPHPATSDDGYHVFVCLWICTKILIYLIY